MSAPEQIITDEQIIKVHAYANFGSMTPREVVNDGVKKYAVGYTGGSTQVAILREHGLITAPKNAGYKANLTEKGKLYARSIYREHLTQADLDAAVAAERKRIIENIIGRSWNDKDFLDGIFLATSKGKIT
jgi:hypothetical protein